MPPIAGDAVIVVRSCQSKSSLLFAPANASYTLSPAGRIACALHASSSHSSLSFSSSFSVSLSPCLAYSISTPARFYLYVIFLVCQLRLPAFPSASVPATSFGMSWQCAYVCFLPSFNRVWPPLSLSLSLSCYRLHSFACGCRFLLLQICCSSNGNLLLTTAAAAMQTRMCSHAHARTHMHRHARTHTGD